jgi:pimeloyl-ACP methyl ester carboxylesterase
MFAEQGLLAVAPDLPYLVDSRDNARAIAGLVAQLRAGGFAPPVQRVVLIGFSAGGLAALLACGSPGVVGYIGLDPFDRPSGIGRDFAASLAVPAALLRAPPSACNAFSIAAPWARSFARIETDRLFEGATHCDFEAPSDFLCRLACGAPDPARQQAIRDEMVRLVRRWLGG